jgi:hypothetical protein
MIGNSPVIQLRPGVIVYYKIILVEIYVLYVQIVVLLQFY